MVTFLNTSGILTGDIKEINLYLRKLTSILSSLFTIVNRKYVIIQSRFTRFHKKYKSKN